MNPRLKHVGLQMNLDRDSTPGVNGSRIRQHDNCPVSNVPGCVPVCRELEPAMLEVFGLLHPAFRETVTAEWVNSRYDVSTPWVDRGWVYATDGRMAVRAPSTPDMERLLAVDGTGKRRPDAAAKFDLPEGVPVPLPPLASLPHCDACNDTRVGTECEECEWAKRFYYDGDDKLGVDCHGCGGTGLSDKPHACNGCRFRRVTVATGVDLSLGYVNRLGRLGVMFCRVQPFHDHRVPVRFDLPGGVEGLLMPLVPEREGGAR